MNVKWFTHKTIFYIFLCSYLVMNRIAENLFVQKVTALQILVPFL